MGRDFFQVQVLAFMKSLRIASSHTGWQKTYASKRIMLPYLYRHQEFDKFFNLNQFLTNSALHTT